MISVITIVNCNNYRTITVTTIIDIATDITITIVIQLAIINSTGNVKTIPMVPVTTVAVVTVTIIAIAADVHIDTITVTAVIIVTAKTTGIVNHN